jgi:hypothetical protein
MLFFTLTMKAHCCHSRIRHPLRNDNPGARLLPLTTPTRTQCIRVLRQGKDLYAPIRVIAAALLGALGITLARSDIRNQRYTQRDPLNPGETAFVTDTIHREKLRTPATWDNTAGRGRY